MIELLQKGSESPLDLGEVHQPARFGLGLPLADKFDPKAMPVEPTALMSRWHLRQPVGGLKRKIADQSDAPTPGGTLRLHLRF